MYEKAPPVHRNTRARILNGLKRSKRDLAKTQAEYEMFKKYKTKNCYKQISN
jgi:hypothetical protein